MPSPKEEDQDSLSQADITQILAHWQAGDDEALGRLTTLVYTELRGMARRYLQSNQDNQTMQPTALIHEVYLQLLQSKQLVFENRQHFFNCARLIMRQVLGRHARRNQAVKRGSGQPIDPLDENMRIGRQRLSPEILLALREALERLGRIDPRKQELVELRFFLGLSNPEIAKALGVSLRTFQREWRTAKSWLARELNKDPIRP